MRFRAAAAFRTPLETRLLTRAGGRDPNRLRTRVAFERFLHCVFAVQTDWMLQGGYPWRSGCTTGRAPPWIWT